MPGISSGRLVSRPATHARGTAVRSCLVILALLAVTACGSGSGTPSLGAPTAAGPTSAGPAASGSGAVSVHVADFKITPAQVDLHGPTVTLDVTNDGPTVHNVSIRDKAGNLLIHTRDLKPGESETISGQLPAGNLVTFCSLPGHESLGTKGALVVEGP